jgi:hypothetical protein
MLRIGRSLCLRCKAPQQNGAQPDCRPISVGRLNNQVQHLSGNREMGKGDPGGQHQGAVTPVPRTDPLLRCIIFSGRMPVSGQKLPPTFATATAELASTPDAKARNC